MLQSEYLVKFKDNSVLSVYALAPTEAKILAQAVRIKACKDYAVVKVEEVKSATINAEEVMYRVINSKIRALRRARDRAFCPNDMHVEACNIKIKLLKELKSIIKEKLECQD